ncbi:MAG: DUF4834 family protein [Bacteroidaceae bacterium]|jgi:hypothetical protein|nr:DUF4834 family protein [Bacteroidaceae bacterium]
MIIIYIILGTILFFIALAAGGIMIIRHYFKNISKRLFGDNEKGSKEEYTRSKRRNDKRYQTNNPPHQQEGKIFSADEGEYIDFEEIKD